MENTEQKKISTPVAIIVAGVLIMVSILLTNSGNKVVKEKTLSEQVGVSKAQLAECIKATDATTLGTKIQASVISAMKALPADQRGTPYSVVIGSNGVKTEIRGADSVENVKKLINEVLSGTVTQKYEGEIALSEEGDHILGNPDAQVKIIEYSDYECPYCKSFHITMNQVVAESDGNV
ncbi:MAG: thioredoxin domain-containing protein, partial [Candidatus Paceibacterota bacterium]